MLAELAQTYVPFMLAWQQAGGYAINLRDISNYFLGWTIERFEK